MADRSEIMGEIEGLEVHCRASLMTVDARSRWMADWCSDLASYPIEAVQSAFRDWRQSGNTKFPTPGQIIPAVRAKLRKVEDVGAMGTRKWEPLTDADYYAASIEDKIRHHEIMAQRARFKAGPMYRAGKTWASGAHLDRADMPSGWHDAQSQADNHFAKARELSKKLRSARERAA